MQRIDHGAHHGVVPPYLLARLAARGAPDFPLAATAARHALEEVGPLTRARTAALRAPVRRAVAVAPEVTRRISDAGNREVLPGRLVRTEGSEDSGDLAVDEAYAGLGATHRLFAEAYGRSSIDGGGGALEATVHYGSQYDNAFWDGERMVFGDGDGEVFGRFTASLTIIAHELTHGFTQHTTNLEYRGQSGALNESLSDVFGVLVEQRELGQDADHASWLVGAGIFTAAVQGTALRSLAAPGTAYDDDVLGRDPQPARMADYVETAEDNGGVHINSGIPNRAFHLVATSLGGPAWERAGRIWYDAVLSGEVPPRCDFQEFAHVTRDAAVRRFGVASIEQAVVASAWHEVGVLS